MNIFFTISIENKLPEFLFRLHALGDIDDYVIVLNVWVMIIDFFTKKNDGNLFFFILIFIILNFITRNSSKKYQTGAL